MTDRGKEGRPRVLASFHRSDPRGCWPMMQNKARLAVLLSGVRIRCVIDVVRRLLHAPLGIRDGLGHFIQRLGGGGSELGQLHKA